MPRELKTTINLPRTDFSMKANLPEMEPRILAEWESRRIYQSLRELRAGAPIFTLHDGPPYANGDVHMGTGLNKILKDFIVKSRSMAGFNAPYLPGWDCHGLPIEIKLDQEFGPRKAEMTAVEFRQACREYAAGFVELHRRDFKRLGIFGDWENPYLTMSPHYEATIASTFLDFLEKGYVYKGLKPVHWCIHCQTALAEAEVEYEDHASPSIWVSFPLAGKEARLGPNVSAIIWTTTPWTLPANRALAFHSLFDYSVVETTDGRAYLLASELVETVTAQLGLKVVRERGRWQGRELENLKFCHPFLDLTVPAVVADYVTLDQGSGIVHTAPGHGAEDFYTGEKYGLEVYCPVDDDGRFSEGHDAYRGQTVFEANAPIVALLRERARLLRHEPFTHSYPHCWRCHHPVIFRATEQWFISLEHNRLRERSIEEIHKVRWIPEWGEERIAQMVSTRPDWCISRQRVWGVPIIVFYCESCGEKLMDPQVLRNVVAWFEREGADAWFARSAKELLPAGTACAKCGATELRKEKDIIDVWFESGCSHLAVLGRDPLLPWPADVYIEGGDQYRGWFHSSLLVAVGKRDAAPYREVLSNGWVLDAKGSPMSKSLGNVVLPREIAEKYGAELVRLWVASSDAQEDLWFSDETLARLAEAYRKIRNTFRFCLGNLYDFIPERDALPADRMWEVDLWMLDRTARLVRDARAWYEGYGFHKVYHALYDFYTVDLSALYLDCLKDRLYTFAPTSEGRRSAQTALYRIAHALVRLIAPLLSFTAEEIWKHLPRRPGEQESVHLELFPTPEELVGDLPEAMRARFANWDRLVQVRQEVLKALEIKRKEKFIGNSLEAKVYLRVDGDLEPLLAEYRTWLPMWFIVSQVELGRERRGESFAAELPGLEVLVARAEGTKCERCWNYSAHVGENKTYPTVCERCTRALAEMEASLGVKG